MSTETLSNASQKLPEFATKTKAQHEQELSGFIGTDYWYQVGENMILTDGSFYALQELKLNWFFTMIHINASAKPGLRHVGAFYVWKYKTTDENQIQLICEDGNQNVLYTQSIDRSIIGEVELIFEEFTVWSDGEVYYLPSEH